MGDDEKLREFKSLPEGCAQILEFNILEQIVRVL
jgi:hypothetical protein